MVVVSVQEPRQFLVHDVDAGHRLGVLSDHLVAVEILQTIVGFNVLNIGVVSIAPEKVEVALFRIVLYHKVALRLFQACCSDFRLIVSDFSNFFNYCNEKARSVLVMGHYSDTLGKLL